MEVCSLLSAHPAHVVSISSETGMPEDYVNRVLSDLLRRHLVRVVQNGQVGYVAAFSPKFKADLYEYWRRVHHVGSHVRYRRCLGRGKPKEHWFWTSWEGERTCSQCRFVRDHGEVRNPYRYRVSYG